MLAHSRSFLANHWQKARNAIFGAENLLIWDIPEIFGTKDSGWLISRK